MGAEIGKPVSNMGITSVAATTPAIEMKEMSAIKAELLKLVTAKETEAFAKYELDEAIKKSGKFEPSDLEIFAKLFILFDVKGDETANYKDFLAGIVGCLTSATLLEKLKFTIELYDSNNSGYISKLDLKRLLGSINLVASYFGDPVLAYSDIETITQDTFKAVSDGSGKGQMKCGIECMEFILSHQLVQIFMLGEGKVRFGSPALNAP